MLHRLSTKELNDLNCVTIKQYNTICLKEYRHIKTML